jgi:hypothetical protein
MTAPTISKAGNGKYNHVIAIPLIEANPVTAAILRNLVSIRTCVMPFDPMPLFSIETCYPFQLQMKHIRYFERVQVKLTT